MKFPTNILARKFAPAHSFNRPARSFSVGSVLFSTKSWWMMSRRYQQPMKASCKSNSNSSNPTVAACTIISRAPLCAVRISFLLVQIWSKPSPCVIHPTIQWTLAIRCMMIRRIQLRLPNHIRRHYWFPWRCRSMISNRRRPPHRLLTILWILLVISSIRPVSKTFGHHHQHRWVENVRRTALQPYLKRNGKHRYLPLTASTVIHNAPVRWCTSAITQGVGKHTANRPICVHTNAHIRALNLTLVNGQRVGGNLHDRMNWHVTIGKDASLEKQNHWKITDSLFL